MVGVVLMAVLCSLYRSRSAASCPRIISATRSCSSRNSCIISAVRGDGVGWRFGRVAPLACHHKSGEADRDQSRREQTLSLCHCSNPERRFKRTIEIQTSFEKKARRRTGKICDFLGAGVFPPHGGSRRKRSGEAFGLFHGPAAEGGEPQGVGTSSDRGGNALGDEAKAQGAVSKQT